MADARVVAAVVGAITGVRSTAGLAAVAHRKARFGMAERLIARGATLLASGESIADKAVDLPARTEPAPLLARAVLGGLAAGLFARRRTNLVTAVALGSATAVVTAVAATRLRRTITENTGIPDAAVGVAEDLVVLAGSTWAVRAAARPSRRFIGWR